MRKIVNMEVVSDYQESFAFLGAEKYRVDDVTQTVSTVSDVNQFHIDELPENELTEFVCDSHNDSLYSLLPSLARLCEEGRWVTLIAPPLHLDEKLFALYGVDLARVLLIHPKGVAQDTSIMNTALKNGTSGIVIYWSRTVPLRFLAQWRKSVKQGCCTGVWVNLSGVASSSKSIALTANVTVSGKFIRVKKIKSFGINNRENSEVVLPILNMNGLTGLKTRSRRLGHAALN